MEKSCGAAAYDEVRFQQNVTFSSPNDIIVKSWPETWRIRVAAVVSPRVFLYHPRDLLSLVQRTRYAHHVPTRKEREGKVVNLKEKWTATPTGQRLASWLLQNRGQNEHRMGMSRRDNTWRSEEGSCRSNALFTLSKSGP